MTEAYVVFEVVGWDCPDFTKGVYSSLRPERRTAAAKLDRKKLRWGAMEGKEIWDTTNRYRIERWKVNAR